MAQGYVKSPRNWEGREERPQLVFGYRTGSGTRGLDLEERKESEYYLPPIFRFLMITYVSS